MTGHAPVLWLLAAFAAALGAAAGALIVAAPPLSVVLQRAGLRGRALALVRTVGKPIGGILLLWRGSDLVT